MPVYKMHGLALDAKGDHRIDYFKVSSATEAYCLATCFGYKLETVQLVADEELESINSTRIESVDPGWLIVTLPIMRRPILTISIGVAVGVLASSAVLYFVGQLIAHS